MTYEELGLALVRLPAGKRESEIPSVPYYQILKALPLLALEEDKDPLRAVEPPINPLKRLGEMIDVEILGELESLPGETNLIIDLLEPSEVSNNRAILKLIMEGDNFLIASNVVNEIIAELVCRDYAVYNSKFYINLDGNITMIFTLADSKA